MLFFSNSLYLTGFSIILSVAVMNIARNQQTRPVPYLVRSVLDGWLGKVLLLDWLCFEEAPADGRQQLGGGRATPRTQEMHEHIGGSGGGGGIAFEDGRFDDDQHIIRNTLAGRIGGVQLNGAKFGPHQHYWIVLATAIDRLAFVLFAFMYVIMATVCAV